MIGLIYWNDESTYYTQTNNPSEELLRKEDGEDFLETCGPTAAVNILAAAGYRVDIECPGTYRPQPEEVLTDWFNDPRNYGTMLTARDGVDPSLYMGNEIPQYYPAAIRDVFAVAARFFWGVSVDDVISALANRCGVMICLEKPGHYIAVVAYDPDTREIVYRDPWPGNPWPEAYRGQSGFNRRISGTENIKGYRIEIGGI
tara:strand:- start:9497 stop:10099 length:603 start_codon:yes stop_codon:yes gene_type:complete